MNVEGNSIFNKIKRFIRNSKGIIFTAALLGAVILLFGTAVNGAAKKADDSSASTLEKAIRRAAVQCYAIEGFYPPEVDYLIDRYGIITDDTKYIVSYTAFASNNLPSIKVKIIGAAD